MQIEAVLPDGRTEVLSRVDRFEWQWPIRYVYAEDVAPLLPASTTLIVTAWHDNSADNPANPDPRQWVGLGGPDGRRDGARLGRRDVSDR